MKTRARFNVIDVSQVIVAVEDMNFMKVDSANTIVWKRIHSRYRRSPNAFEEDLIGVILSESTGGG